MNCNLVSRFIVEWLQTKIEETRLNGFVVGVSGGIDSAVVSTLCAKTGFTTIALNMPILQANDQYNLSQEQIEWLINNFKNVSPYIIDLTNVFNELMKALPLKAKSKLSLVNCRARLRMIALYSFANSNNYFVCGTGNKIEDFGIGFFTKYGDGGVDLNPIGDLLKSEVYDLAAYLEIPETIQKTSPTNGLWEIDKTDEDQIGATYNELEFAMNYCETNKIKEEDDLEFVEGLSDREITVLKLYLIRHNSNRHKMMMPPICDLSSVK